MASSNASPLPLNELVRLHRKAVQHPFFWTSDHLGLLGGRFDDLTTVDGESSREATAVSGPAAQSRANKPHGAYHGMCRKRQVISLEWSSSPMRKLYFIKKLLVGAKLPFRMSCSGPGFFYAGKIVHQAAYVALYPHDRDDRSGGTVPPLTGYVDYSEIQRRRRRKCIQHSNRFCLSSYDTSEDKISRVTPKDWSEDPYLVCILLSIAQRQSTIKSKHDQDSNSTCRACLLVTTESGSKFIYLFELYATAELLQSFKKPHPKSKSATFPVIKRTRISFEPCVSFRSRIMELLGDQPKGTSSGAVVSVAGKPEQAADGGVGIDKERKDEHDVSPPENTIQDSKMEES
ncbi:hypothetical protein V2A60_004401 [Cordyceps javanica]|uniref:Uncharacterized protein n=1 Tax=Cordyceps javanica TaxID=43265 RepID=A0A545URL4_9HYPO|nr:hypothetical protein IF1G_09173 [Cordyceps javanica]TQW04111.1 hypothetical protein IF2G_08425 [Cordyceps javanica]